MKKILVLLAVTVVALNVGAAEKKKELVTGETQEFEALNPLIAQMVATYYINGMVNRTLTTMDASWKWVPLLATKIPTFENGMVKKIQENGKEKMLVQWEIPENAKWGDGTPLTGYDVQFSWEVASAPEVSVGEKEVYTAVEEIKVDPQHPNQFTMKFDKPRWDYYQQMGTFYIIPKHLEEAVFKKTKGQIGAYEKQTLYVTNPTNPGLYFGPYVVKEVKLGSHVILERNPFFYGKQASIERIVFKLIPNSQVLEANLRSGAINMISEASDFTLDQALSLEKRATPQDAFAVHYQQGTTFEHIDVNLHDPILKDVRVRKALMYGMDRDKMIQALFEGKYSKALHRVHPRDRNFTSDVNLYPYDPSKAMKLLEDAGWKVGPDGFRQKGGKGLEVVLMTTAENKLRSLVEVFLQNEWKKIGVKTVIKNEPARVFFGETVRKGNFPQLVLFAWVSSPENPPKSVLHSKNIPTQENGFNGQNTGGYVNKKIDKILDTIDGTFDANKRDKLIAELLKIEMEELPTFPLYYRAQIAVLPKNLKGYEITGHQFQSSNFVETWDLE